MFLIVGMNCVRLGLNIVPDHTITSTSWKRNKRDDGSDFLSVVLDSDIQLAVRLNEMGVYQAKSCISMVHLGIALLRSLIMVLTY